MTPDGLCDSESILSACHYSHLVTWLRMRKHGVHVVDHGSRRGASLEREGELACLHAYNLHLLRTWHNGLGPALVQGL